MIVKLKIMKALSITLFTLICVRTMAQPDFKNQPAVLMEESRVWSGTENGMKSHRILGLTMSKGGVILAFTEGRIDGSDEGPHDLVSRRSLDNGATWSANIVIEKSDGIFWKQQGTPDKLECWTNPAALTDFQSGRIFFFYALNDGRYQHKNTQRMTRVFYKFSDDEGLSWSDRIEITDMLNSREDGTPNLDNKGNQIKNEEGFACDFLGRSFHMPGPGHGIQLKNGRLMLQFWHRTSIGKVSQDSIYEAVPEDKRQYGTSVIYSDDHGSTWKQGGRIAVGHNATESRIVELTNGNILINSRVNSQTKRYVAVSDDRGMTWIDSKEPGINFTAVDCGLISIGSPNGDAMDWLLLSHPRDEKKRQGMTVSLSKDGGVTWPESRLVYAYGSAYSDLVRLPDGSFGLLYEKSANRPDVVSPSEIAFVRFSYKWIIQDR